MSYWKICLAGEHLLREDMSLIINFDVQFWRVREGGGGGGAENTISPATLP